VALLASPLTVTTPPPGDAPEGTGAVMLVALQAVGVMETALAMNQRRYTFQMTLKLRTRNGIAEKLCSCCQQWKPLDAFSPGGKSHERTEGGRHCECRECNNARHRRRYAALKSRI